MKKLHRYITFLVLPFIILLSGTGAILSLQPALERFGAPVANSQMTVASIAALATKRVEGVERIRRSANGQLIVDIYNVDGAQTKVLNTSTRELTDRPKSSGFVGFVKELHRSLFLEETGKALVGVSGAAMALLCITGIFVLKTRAGGWLRIIARQSGSGPKRWHVEISRGLAPLLVLLSVSALQMSAESFGLLVVRDAAPTFPTKVQTGTPLTVEKLPALERLPVEDLRELQFPFPEDPSDVFTLKTSSGTGYIDQVSGELLAFKSHSFSTTLYEWVYLLHTGQGAWFFGLILGVVSLAVLVLSVTGMFVWVRGFVVRPSIGHNTPLIDADIVIGVGSEGHSTWGFAKTLHAALHQANFKVHTTELNNVSQAHFDSGRLLLLTSTYGDGGAPQNAARFVENMKNVSVREDFGYAVLGFGDSGFPNFCGFAEKIDRELCKVTQTELMPLGKIDKQCTQNFTLWGTSLGAALGINLELEHTLQQPKTRELKLVSRQNYATLFGVSI